jgi:hypothetical protein
VRYATLFASLATLLFAMTGAAAESSYVTIAYGGIKCAGWTTVRAAKPLDAAVYEGWIFGFLSAYNAFVYKGPNVAEGTTIDTMRSMVDDYCKKNAGEDLDSAAQALIKELLKKHPQ